MDSLTHIAIGACIGEAFFEKRIGKKAMIWGILSQSIPDIDFLAALWLPPADNLLAHRGFTHSVLFALVAITLLALLADKVHKPHNISFKKWILFFSIEVFVHLFIDSYNNYGIGLLEPFSHERYSLNAIYVADPFFSIWPGIACIALLALGRNSTKRKLWWKFGLFIPLLYLGYCSINKIIIDKEVKRLISKQHVPASKYFTTPAPLQNWLWFVVAGNDNGYYVAYRSVFDKDDSIRFQHFPKNDSLLKPLADSRELQQLKQFSKGFYTAEQWDDSLVFNDLRFGQVIGWVDPREKFAFHYFLQHPSANKLVVQRGRFAKWNWSVVKSLFNRAMGY